MTIIDLMTTKKPDFKLRSKVLGKIGVHKPTNCFQCIRCTSGCPSMRMLENKPHEIVSLVRLGFIEDVINSGIIWTCSNCLKCKERCPQEVAPVDLYIALRNLAVEMEAKIPADYLKVVTTILETGYIQRPQEVITREFEELDRGKLGLPVFLEPDEKFKSAFLKALENC